MGILKLPDHFLASVLEELHPKDILSMRQVSEAPFCELERLTQFWFRLANGSQTCPARGMSGFTCFVETCLPSSLSLHNTFDRSKNSQGLTVKPSFYEVRVCAKTLLNHRLKRSPLFSKWMVFVLLHGPD